jgi:hypothetical protein
LILERKEEGNRKDTEKMEIALAILIIIGIFVGIPALIGCTIFLAYAWTDRGVRRTERIKLMKEGNIGVRETIQK